MKTSLRFLALSLVVAALTGLSRRARADDDPGAALARSLRPLEPLAHTGVLYDRVLPVAHLEQLNGGPASPLVDRSRFRQAIDEVRRASLGSPVVPDLASFDAGVAASRRAGEIPLALLDVAYDRVRDGALADGSLRIARERVEPGDPSETPLVTSRAFAFAALAARTYRGGDVTFALDPSRIFADEPAGRLAIDFDDGAGFRSVRAGERARIHYAATGMRTLTARLTRASGGTLEARTSLMVSALATPLPNDTLHVTATVPYQGQLGTGDAYVDLAPGRTAIANPVVVIEGFDLDNSMNWDELYALLNEQNLLEDLRAEGFDVIVLNFTDATVAIQQNSYVVEALLEQVAAAMPRDASIALVGASMGGLCSRYALAFMEKNSIPHHVRTWIAFDTPHAGADVPLGLQYWINFFAGQSTDAATFLAELNRPAARQMLLYHYTSPSTASGQPDPLRATFLSDLAAVGDFPRLPRRVAISNGSATGANQGFLPGDPCIRWEYSSLFVAVTGDVWAVPDQTSKTIFNGSTRVLFTTTSQSVTVSGTKPWDGAPGGSRASFAELDSVPAPYGDIVALHPSHCFIPTISSLDLATTDPFFDVAGAPNLLSLSPFDALDFQSTNQEHVEITPQNAAWVKSEIENGIVGVGDLATRGPLRLEAGPNPATGAITLTFALPTSVRTRLAIFDLDGREVRRLSDGSLTTGWQSLRWDGLDRQGARVPAGIYFARLEAGANTATVRFARLR